MGEWMPDYEGDSEWIFDQDMEECECDSCKGKFAVPFYESLPEVGHPSFCPFCGCEFDSCLELEV